MSRNGKHRVGEGFAAALAVLMAQLAFAGHAEAACAVPVLADCQKPAYLASACGIETRGGCDLLLQAAFIAQSDKVSETKRALLPNDLVNSGRLATKQGVSAVVETAKVAPYSYSTQFAHGTTAHYAGVVQRGAISTLSRTSFLPQTAVERASNSLALSTQINPNLFPGPNTNPNGGPGQPEEPPGPPVIPGNLAGNGNLALAGATVLHQFDNGSLAALGAILSQIADKRERWKADGARVNSCEEYVYQRYTTFSTFEDAAGELGNDYPAIFELAYTGTDTGRRGPFGTPGILFDVSIANKHIRDERGNIVTDIEFEPFTPRNIYYEWQPGNPGDQTYPIKAVTRYWETVPARSATLTDLHFDASPWEWSWSEFRAVGNEYLATYNADLLEELDGRKFDFQQLLTRRRAIRAAYNAARAAAIFKNVSCPNPADPGHKKHGEDCGRTIVFEYEDSSLGPLDEEYGVKLSEIDALIDTAFENAPYGCVHEYTSHVRNACDWSPHEFYRFLVDQMNVKRELDYKRCVAVTANNFSVAGRLYQIKSAGLPEAGIEAADWNASSAKLTELIEKFRVYVAKLRADLPISGGVAKGAPPTFGDDESDNQTSGNGTFGAGYHYDIGWTVDGLGTDGSLTDLTVEAHAKFTSQVTLLGIEIPIIDAEASIAPNKVDNNQFDEKMHFRVLNEDIFVPVVDDTTPEPVFNLVLQEGVSPDLPSPPPAVVLVMGIPVKFKVGASGTASFNVGLHGDLARHHEADATKDTVAFNVGGSATPKMGLVGFASASIDLAIVEVGIKGELTILSVELPLTVDLSVKNDEKGALVLAGDTQLDAALRSLDGRIALFIKVIFLGSVEQNLISWRGPGINQNLFHNKFGPLPLSDVQKALNAAL